MKSQCLISRLRHHLAAFVGLCGSIFVLSNLSAQEISFSYQGRLQNNGTPANGV